MAYDESKDKVLKVFTYENEGNCLLFSIMAYNGGSRKLQMTRTYLKKDQTAGYGKVGRLSIDELKFLCNNMEKIVEIMEGD